MTQDGTTAEKPSDGSESHGENSVSVVDVHKAQEDAYHLGYARFEGMDEPTDDWEFHHFTDTAEYANIVLPKLRARAGYLDGGHGTYRAYRPVVLVEEPEDEPADGTLLDSPTEFYQELLDYYRAGAIDAAHGRDREVPDAL